ncbi:MAG TPA: N-methyl-L-tryptophan oxidase [Verrucomicrobiae bacterium]|jgi:sarcosine oxidase|nr:N-methyl-L-tryptophan oxidase [Verrucomicrobiae bacterium]
MSESHFDVIVAGLGAMGSAALYHLARAGVKALGIDRFEPPHTLGSSHGETRVIREAYYEDPVYVPLVQRAYELWADLERESGETLYVRTGGLMIGLPESDVVSGALRSAKEHHLPHELLNSAEIQRRFPGLHPEPGMEGVLEPRAGILFPEKCLAAHLKLAKEAGATIRTNERILDWGFSEQEVRVRTGSGEFHGSKLILACGPWLPGLLEEQAATLPGLNWRIERQILLWFKALEPKLFTPDRFPIYLFEYEPGKTFYGFPDLGSGVKIAFHHQGETTSPETIDREVRERDIEKMRGMLRGYLPEANGEFLRGTVCIYTNTPDAHFVVDHHPASQRVILASPCSGHGFKFASVIGEVLAGLAADKKPRVGLKRFSLARFP